ncbi:hypothetical protein ABK040_005624 [Willaertia magna]
MLNSEDLEDDNASEREASSSSNNNNGRIEAITPALQLIEDIIIKFQFSSLMIDKEFDKKEIKQIEKNLSDELSKLLLISEPHPKLTYRLLNFLENLENRNLQCITLEFLTKLCSGTNMENEKIIDTLEILFKRDSELTRPIISTLYQLNNLIPTQQDKILQLAGNALESISEEKDLQQVVKIMLKNITKKTGKQIVNCIRKLLANDDTISISICTEILAEAFSTNPFVASQFLKSFKDEDDTELSRLDVLILLVYLTARDRERNQIFIIFKNAFLKKPKRRVQLSTIIDALCIEHTDMILQEKFSKSVYVFVIYILTNSGIYTDENGKPWIYLIFIVAFQMYPSQRAKLLSSLLAMFQYSNDPSSSIAGDILIGLSTQEEEDEESEEANEWCKILATDFQSILKDALSHAVSYSPKCQHCLCYVLSKLCRYEPKLFEFLMIFVRKQLFSGQDNRTQLGIVASTHIIKETQWMSVMDIERFVINMFNTKSFDSNTIYLLDLFIHNVLILKEKGFQDKIRTLLESLMSHIQLTTFGLNREEDNYFKPKQLCASNRLQLDILQTLSKLIKCYIIYHEDENIAYELSTYGMQATTKEELICDYVICSTLCYHFVEKYNRGVKLNQDEKSALLDLTNYLLKLRIDIPATPQGSTAKINTEDIFLTFQLDIHMLSQFILSDQSAHSSNTEAIHKKMMKEALKCLWTNIHYNLTDLLRTKQDINMIDIPSQNISKKNKEKSSASKPTITTYQKIKFHFGSMNSSLGSRSYSSIHQFIKGNENVFVKIFSLTEELNYALVDCKEDLNTDNEKEKELTKNSMERIAVCLGYCYTILSNVIYTCRVLDENLFEELLMKLVSFENGHNGKEETLTPFSCAQNLIEQILSQFIETSYFTHAIQLTLLLTSIAEGRMIQSLIGYFGLLMSQSAYSTLSNHLKLEKLIFDSHILISQPFYHVLLYREIKLGNWITDCLTQAPSLFILSYLPSDDGKTFIDTLMISLYEFIGMVIENEEQEEKHKFTTHDIFKSLDEISFHSFYQLLTKIVELAITNAPSTPLVVSNATVVNNNTVTATNTFGYFQRIEEAIENLIRLIFIMNYLQECNRLKRRKNKSAELLVQCCLCIIPKLEEKLLECLKYRVDKSDNLDDVLSPEDYISLIDKMKSFCKACFALCEKQKKFSDKNSKQDGKLRQTMLRLFTKQNDLENTLRNICYKHHIPCFIEDNDEEEEDGNNSTQTEMWKPTNKKIKKQLMEKLNSIKEYHKNLLESTTTNETTTLMNENLWELLHETSFLDKCVLFSVEYQENKEENEGEDESQLVEEEEEEVEENNEEIIVLDEEEEECIEDFIEDDEDSDTSSSFGFGTKMTLEEALAAAKRKQESFKNNNSDNNHLKQKQQQRKTKKRKTK